MMSVREKLANTADDFKVMDRLFAWFFIRGYKGTDHHVANDMENDLMRVAKISKEVIRQLQHIGREKRSSLTQHAVLAFYQSTVTYIQSNVCQPLIIGLQSSINQYGWKSWRHFNQLLTQMKS